MIKLAPLSVVCFALFLAAPANASLRVHPSPDYTAEWTAFEIEADECGGINSCEGGLVITRAGQVVHTEELFISNVSEGRDATYNWSCRRVGHHDWAVTITATSLFDNTQQKLTATGGLRIGRCTRWKRQRVSRGRAAATAARNWPNQFVSSSRCTPRSRARGGRASRWRCRVTHNNTYRECVNTVSLRFLKRLRFGALDKDRIETVGRARCSYF